MHAQSCPTLQPYRLWPARLLCPSLCLSRSHPNYYRTVWSSGDLPGGSAVKNPPAGDMGWIPGWGRSPGGGHDNPLHYSCLENPMDRGAWRVTVHGVAKSQTWLKLDLVAHIWSSGGGHQLWVGPTSKSAPPTIHPLTVWPREAA